MTCTTGRDRNRISELTLIQLSSPHKISCIIASIEIPLQSLTTGWPRRRDGAPGAPSSSCRSMTSSRYVLWVSDVSTLIKLSPDWSILKSFDDFQIFKDVKRVVDLCAAPGSWSQVLSKKLRLEVRE